MNYQTQTQFARIGVPFLVMIGWLLTAPGILRADDPEDNKPPVTSWKSDKAGRDALIWKYPMDEIGSMAVVGGNVLVGGRIIEGNVARGAMLCLAADTGKLRWRVTHEHLPHRANDMVGCISSTPFIEHDRVYYVSNRGELCCVAIADGQEIWKLDMPREFGVFKRDPSDVANLAPSPIVVGDIVFCITGNGISEGKLPAPNAPSFIAVSKSTGHLIWSSNAPGSDISYGQWSTPALARVEGEDEILFPGGDGALHSFEPLTGKQLWKLSVRDPQKDWTWDFVTAPPLVDGATAYVSPSLDMEFSGKARRLFAIDLHTHAIRWTCSPKEYTGTLGPMVLENGVLYAVGTRGMAVAVRAKDGTLLWKHDLEENVLSGVCLSGEKLFIGNDAGEIAVLSKTTGQKIDECQPTSGVGFVGTPVVRDGNLFMFGRREVVALRLP